MFKYFIKNLYIYRLIIHGDTLVLDRWLWLKRRLPKTGNNESLLDIGCGNGALTFTAEKFGYISTGISWDELNHRRSQERAKILGAYNANFICFDVRNLDKFIEMKNNYDFILNFENIEHIIDDKKLMIDISNC